MDTSVLSVRMGFLRYMLKRPICRVLCGLKRGRSNYFPDVCLQRGGKISEFLDNLMYCRSGLDKNFRWEYLAGSSSTCVCAAVICMRESVEKMLENSQIKNIAHTELMSAADGWPWPSLGRSSISPRSLIWFASRFLFSMVCKLLAKLSKKPFRFPSASEIVESNCKQ